MQVVWVLVAVKMVSGLNAGGVMNGNSYGGDVAMPHWQQVTAGMFAGENECRTAARALGSQPGIKPFSARCQPERLQ
jgi:hypothetical protein